METVSKTFEINARPVSDLEISLSSDSFSYTGSAIEPDVTVKHGTRTLLPGSDYTVSYSDNTGPGTGSVKITGMRYYTGTVSKSFTINKVSIAGASVTNVYDQAYTGKAVTQKPTVKLKGKILTAGKDYTVVYENNTEPGTATMKIKGKGGYKGTVTVTFEIADETVTPGDINGDGSVNMKDLAELQRYVNGWGNTINLANSDLTGDGSINMKDVAELQKLINGGTL